jgi:oligopeptide transport system substrate-binding protein
VSGGVGVRRGLVAPLALALAACAAEEAGPYFGTTHRPHADLRAFYVNNYAEPETIDPGLAHDGASGVIILQLFEGLSSADPRDGHLIQGVATRWEQSADNRRFRFHLRPEARWSDGVPVTAADFEYAWKRVLRPSTAALAAPALYVLKNGERFHKGELADDAAVGVRAVDDRTLDVELEAPTPYFLELTCSVNLLPVRRDVIEAAALRGAPFEWVRPERIVVNGPYMLDGWKFRYEITMKQNPAYWASDELRIERIVWLMVDHQHTSMNLYKAGEIDFLGDNAPLPSDYLRVVAQKRDYHRFPFLGTLWYELNTKRPPLDDVRVRRALNMAVDKQRLVASVLGGGQLPAAHYVPDFVGSGYSTRASADRAAGADPFAMKEASCDPEGARALLREAGYRLEGEGSARRARGFPSLELLYNPLEEHRAVAVALQDAWRRELGVTVTLRSEEWKVMLKSIHEGQFQIARLGWFADYDHPHDWLSSFVSDSPQNPTGWGSAAFDALVRRAAATADQGESMKLYRQAEALALGEMPRVPLYFREKSTVVKPWVKGFYGSARDRHLVRWLWIDPAWESNPGNAPAAEPREFPPPGRL